MTTGWRRGTAESTNRSSSWSDKPGCGTRSSSTGSRKTPLGVTSAFPRTRASPRSAPLPSNSPPRRRVRRDRVSLPALPVPGRRRDGAHGLHDPTPLPGVDTRRRCASSGFSRERVKWCDVVISNASHGGGFAADPTCRAIRAPCSCPAREAPVGAGAAPSLLHRGGGNRLRGAAPQCPARSCG